MMFMLITHSCNLIGSLASQTYCVRAPYIGHAEEEKGKIRLVYLDRFLCALPEYWRTNQIADCSIGYSTLTSSEYHVFKKCTLVVFIRGSGKNTAVAPAPPCLLP